MEWVLAVLLVAAGLFIATRKMNPGARAAAFDTIGRRHAWKVAGWPVLRLVIAAALVWAAVAVVRAGGGEQARPPASTSTSTSTTPAVSAGVPLAAWVGAALIALAIVIGLAVHKRHADSQLAQLLEEDYAPRRATGQPTEPIREDDDDDEDGPVAQVHQFPRRG